MEECALDAIGPPALGYIPRIGLRRYAKGRVWSSLSVARYGKPKLIQLMEVEKLMKYKYGMT